MNIFDKKSISGSFDLTSTKVPLYTTSSLSCFRIQFSKEEGSVNPYISAKACVITADEVKIFIVVFKDENNNEFTTIQIPLVGQKIDNLIAEINGYADVYAEVENSAGFVSTSLIEDTAFVDISGKWAYFTVTDINVNSVYTSLDTDLRFFLTTPEPVSVQKNLVQSLGGYVSLSEVYRGYAISDALSIYDKIVYLNTDSISLDFSLVDLQKSSYLQINDEIVKISKWVSNVGYISERNVFGTPLRMHPKGSIIKEISKNDFFDANLGPDRKQYRCIAIKNTNNKDIAKNMKVFCNIPSRNNLSTIRLAIENPISDYYKGTSSSQGITAFSDNSLVGKLTSSHFVSSPIYFINGPNAGQVRLVKSYNPTSGTIEIDQRLPNNISFGESYVIDTAPCQKTKSGTKAPSGSRVSAFFDANNEESAISINVNGGRDSNVNLLPNEVVYVWIERAISASNDEFLNNRFSLTVSYSKI